MDYTFNEIDILGEYDDYFFDKARESEEEFIKRKRGADLFRVVDKIILEELSPIERDVIFQCEIQDMPPKEIAQLHSINRSAVYKIRTRALKKLEGFLKYVLIYRSESEKLSFSPVEFRKSLFSSYYNQSPEKSLHHRLRKLMAQMNVDSALLSSVLSVSKNHAEELIEGKRPPDNDELVKLSLLFNTTADYLLCGKVN